MESFLPASVAQMSFFADSAYSNYDINRYERGIPMYSSSLPWPVFSDRPPISGHSEFTISNSHRHPSKPQIHDTAKFSSGPAFEAFRYNYDATFLQRVNGISSLATTAMESSNREKRSEKEERKLSCGICYKVFMRPSALRVHMRIHNGEKPFQCVHCPRSFSQSGNLTVHMRIHTGEKPFTCTICRKGFSQSNSLKVHIRTHTGEKPFKCRSCRKRFTDRSSLAKHVRAHADADVEQIQRNSLL